jgi:NitT/TauT family transport system substrate-binding protein
VAEKDAYFAQQGITVELVQFASALERDTAIQTGQIDGQLNDLISTTLLNKDQDRVRAVRVARRAMPDRPQFSILAAPSSKIQTVNDLKGVEIAISSNTVIEYITDRMLQGSGFTSTEIKKIEVTKIPVRLELLSKGQVQAATLPDPFTPLAIKAGARVVLDDTRFTQYSLSVVSFRVDVLKTKPLTVKKFLAAYEQAVAAMTAHPATYMDLLIEKANIPEALRGSYTMPPFPSASVPTKTEVEDVVAWAMGKGLITTPIPYEKMVDGSYLPK